MTNDIPAEGAVLNEPENLCEGNPDDIFHPLIIKSQGVFTHLQGMQCRKSVIIAYIFYFLCTISVVAYYDWHHSTIRHMNLVVELPDGTLGGRGVKYTSNIET